VNPDTLGYAVLGVAVVLGAAAAYAGTNEVTAVPLAAGAAVAGAAFAAIRLAPRVRTEPVARPIYEPDPLVALRAAFREGAIGRQRIAQAIGELERSSGLGRTRAGPDEIERHPERVSAPAFRTWVETRLADLERRT